MCLWAIIVSVVAPLYLLVIIVTRVGAAPSGGDREWRRSGTEAALPSALLPASLCTIDRVPLDAISREQFETFYAERLPVILHGSKQAAFTEATERVRATAHMPDDPMAARCLL